MRYRMILTSTLLLIVGTVTAALASDFSVGAGFWSDKSITRSDGYILDYSRSGLRLVAEGQVGALGGEVEVLTGKVNSFDDGESYDIDFSKVLGVSVIGTYHFPLSNTVTIAPLLGYSTDRSAYGVYNDMYAAELGNQDGYEEEWVDSGFLLGARATMQVSSAIQASLDYRYTPNASGSISWYDKYGSNWYRGRIGPYKGTKTQWRLGMSAQLTPAWSLEGGYAGSSLFFKEQESSVIGERWDIGHYEYTYTRPSETTSSNILFLGAAYRF